MKAYAEKFYKGKQWQTTREAYAKSKRYLCEKCFFATGEIVHHIRPITKANINNPDITLNWDNLQLLCRPCHEKAHRKKERRYTVDEYGHVTPIGE